MIRFLLKKLGYATLILFSVATLIFFLFSFSFPNPEEMMVGQRSDQETRDAIKKEFGLDQPIATQYVLYINDLSPLSFYKDEVPSAMAVATSFAIGSTHVVFKAPYLRSSFQNRSSVSGLLRESLLTTGVLAIVSITLAAFFGIFFGLIAAIQAGSWLDRSLLLTSMAGISLPSFMASILIAWVFGFVLSEFTGLNMTGSLFDVHPVDGKVVVWKNLLLPALALGMRPLSIITQLTRSSLLEVMSQDFIRTARAKGMTELGVIIKHALPNALNPVITSLSGWFASLLAGSFFVEFIFNWNGLGKLTINALSFLDLPVVMGSILLIASIFVVINLLVDYLYTVLDPRVKLEE